MSEPLLITFAVNDDNGCFRYRCSGVTISEAVPFMREILTMEGWIWIDREDGEVDSPELPFDYYPLPDGATVRLRDTEFPIFGYVERVREPSHSSGHMHPSDVADLVNLLLPEPGWTCKGLTALSEKWDRREPFTAQDFGAEPEAERPCAYTVAMQFEEVS